MLNEERKGYIGNPSQLALLRRVTAAEGKAKGSGIIEVRTAGGLELDILPDSGLDIGQCRFRGINMSWMSKNGYDSPITDNPHENEFVNTFPGGLLYTCGLRNAGPANRDGEEWHPLHGRYHSLAAEQVCTEMVGGDILIRGVIRETALFGHALEVRRQICVPVYGSSVTVEDTVTNLTPQDEEYMQIYHCNFGYPLLSEEAKLALPEDRETIPRTEFAGTAMSKQCVFEEPVPGEEERCWFQKMCSEFRARLDNPKLDVSMSLSWSGDTLPLMVEWRSMAGGDYVLGLEPTNCYIMGRKQERENGTLPVLKAFESVRHTVVISFGKNGEGLT